MKNLKNVLLSLDHKTFQNKLLLRRSWLSSGINSKDSPIDENNLNILGEKGRGIN